MAAPRKNPPHNAAEEILTLAATGFSLVGIGAHFRISEETLERWFDDYPALRQAFKAGREKERAALHNVLYTQAVEKGNIIAAMFLLKSRHSYVEGDRSDVANRVSIQFNLPGALTPEQYALAKVAKVTIDGDNTSNSAKQLPTIAVQRP